MIQQKKLKIKLLLDYKYGFWFTKLYLSLTKVAFRLQNFTSQLQKTRFELQSGISPYNSVRTKEPASPPRSSSIQRH